MKRILYIVVLLVSFQGFGQTPLTTRWLNTAADLTHNRGGLRVDGTFYVARDTAKPYYPNLPAFAVLPTGLAYNWSVAAQKWVSTDRSVVSMTITGGSTKTIILTFNDGSTVQQSFTDLSGTGGGGITEEVDPTIANHIKNITTTNIANWNAAHLWGNHAGLYRPISYVPTWGEITGKPASFTPSVHSHVIADVTNLQTTLNGKQEALVSGSTIKTINNQSLLGSGNITVSVDTTTLSNRINLKLNTSDTAAMLSKYLKESDTAHFAHYAPEDVEFVVGTTAGAPAVGTTTVNLTGSIGWSARLYRGRLKQSRIDDGSGLYYTKPINSETLTISNTWQAGELVQIEFYRSAGALTVVGGPPPAASTLTTSDGYILTTNDGYTIQTN